MGSLGLVPKSEPQMGTYGGHSGLPGSTLLPTEWLILLMSDLEMFPNQISRDLRNHSGPDQGHLGWGAPGNHDCQTGRSLVLLG